MAHLKVIHQSQVKTDITNDVWVISIRDLVIPCFVGIRDHEKLSKQPVRISIKCHARLNQGLTNDFNYICYDNLIRAIEAFIDQGHIDLVEHMAEGILDICFKHESVYRVFISVEKTAVYDHVASVGVEIERYR